ncbi:hypothetical protein A0H76_420 [Hepatospora eriocheir]|uniref:Uncharacterized protein n=1 Tax=Hepatospora eriocheir TaxID=1081669 RepID=A0A1X0QAP0_9MICR|nr:hypothetical protein A0H76_420 [Hepatospora eriocheir]
MIENKEIDNQKVIDDEEVKETEEVINENEIMESYKELIENKEAEGNNKEEIKDDKKIDDNNEQKHFIYEAMNGFCIKSDYSNKEIKILEDSKNNLTFANQDLEHDGNKVQIIEENLNNKFKTKCELVFKGRCIFDFKNNSKNIYLIANDDIKAINTEKIINNNSNKSKQSESKSKKVIIKPKNSRSLEYIEYEDDDSPPSCYCF